MASTFAPAPNQTITIGDTTYRFLAPAAAHPDRLPVAGVVGRVGVVYQLVKEGGESAALKVFLPPYQDAALLDHATKMSPIALIQGLSVCRRTVLNPQQHAELLQAWPALRYSVLMPWARGDRWSSIVDRRMPLMRDQSLRAAHALVNVLGDLEQSQLTHGALTGSNLLIDGLGSTRPRVELVDVEGLNSPALPRPNPLMRGTLGHLPHRLDTFIWRPEADAFSGAVLLAEMLGWANAEVRAAAHGSSYFSQDELQLDTPRYRTLLATLEAQWGAPVATLFARAWNSRTLADCPPFSAWKAAMEPIRVKVPAQVDDYLQHGRVAIARSDRAAALSAYTTALTLLDPADNRRHEVQLILDGLRAQATPPPAEAIATRGTPIPIDSRSAAQDRPDDIAPAPAGSRAATGGAYRPLLWLGLLGLFMLLGAGGAAAAFRLMGDNDPEPAAQIALVNTAEPPTAAPTATTPPTETAAPAAALPTAEPATSEPAATDAPTETPTRRPTRTPAPSPTVVATTEATAEATSTPATNNAAASLAVWRTVTAGAGLPLSFENPGIWRIDPRDNGAFTQSNTQAHDGRFSGRFDYRFQTAGDDRVIALQVNDIPGRPDALRLWVYGDRSGNWLYAWFTDADGQTWQTPFGRVSHSGWQQMTARITTDQPFPWTHVSGPNNGVVDYPIRLLGLMLDDSIDSYRGEGAIYLDELTAGTSGAGQQASAGPSNTPRPTATRPGTTAPTPTRTVRPTTIAPTATFAPTATIAPPTATATQSGYPPLPTVTATPNGYPPAPTATPSGYPPPATPTVSPPTATATPGGYPPPTATPIGYP